MSSLLGILAICRGSVWHLWITYTTFTHTSFLHGALQSTFAATWDYLQHNLGISGKRRAEQREALLHIDPRSTAISTNAADNANARLVF